MRLRLRLLLLAWLPLLALCPDRGPLLPARLPRLPAPDPVRIMAIVDSLAAYPTRFAASAQLPAVRRFLARRIRAAGLEPREQIFALRVGRFTTEQANVYALLPGRDPARPWLVLTAHYDSINEGWEGETASLTDPEARAPGAGDNASGVAVLLEAMRLLAADPPACGVVFLFPAAEEMGQAGSRSWAETVLPGLEPVGRVLNVDQVGKSRSWPRSLRLFTRGPGVALAHRLERLALAATPDLHGWHPCYDDPYAKSDHGPFLDRGLAAVSVCEGPGYYPWEDQGIGDLPEKLDPRLLEAVTRLVIATALDPDPPRPSGARPPAASR